MATIRNKQSFQLTKDSTRYVKSGGTGTVNLLAGQYVSAITFLVPRQEILLMQQNPKVFLKLYNTSGDQISDGAKILISIKKPTQELPQEIGNYKQYYEYSALSMNDQSNIKYDSSTRFEMKNSGSYPEESEILVLVNSPIDDNIDWDNPQTKIAIGQIGKDDLMRGEYN